MRWLVDDILVGEAFSYESNNQANSTNIENGANVWSEYNFDHPFYLILNVAVGGNSFENKKLSADG